MNKNNKKLSREDIAKIEIGHTDVTPAKQWALTLFFLLFISIYPCIQFFYHNPLTEWKKMPTLLDSIKNYETSAENTSFLRKFLLPPAQRFMTSCLHTGNEKVIIGRDGWLFFAGDMEYLINPGFLKPEILHKRIKKGVQPDPQKAILDFNEQLKSRGIRLILLPVPVKPMIYADKLSGKIFPLHNNSFAKFKAAVEAAGITVINLADEFAEMRKNGIDTYLKTDTHWNPTGMKLAAARLASAIGGKSVTPVKSCGRNRVINAGDTVAMLKLPDPEKFFPEECVYLSEHKSAFSKDSDILLLGDSFANIYSLHSMNWGSNSGLAENLSALIGKPVDAILRNDNGSFATRTLLANELKRGRDRLAGKKVVIWEFAIREMANGDWKLLDMTPGETPETDFLKITAPREITGTVLDISAVPQPFAAPYKDHILSIHLGDIDGGKDQVLVYAVSMQDNKLTDAARLRVGDSVKIRLEPWNKHDSVYGSWTRSEFDSESLLLAEPCWGIL